MQAKKLHLRIYRGFTEISYNSRLYFCSSGRFSLLPEDQYARRIPMKKSALMVLVLGFAFALAAAQDQGQGPGSMRGPGDGVAGKVTAVGKDSITITPIRGGDAIVVKVGDNTRISKERQPVKLSDITVGDTVFARGSLDGNTMQAGGVRVVNPEMAQRMGQGGGMGFGTGNGQGGGRGQFNPADWGKTFIAGRIKSINETTLTISRPDNQEQTLNVQVDENTSFKKGREDITLTDIKADDFVFGQGEVKNGVFMVKELHVGGGRMGPPGAAPDASKAESEKPAPPPKN
jgi:hypothetical protein